MLLEDRIVKFAAQCVKTCALLPVKFIGSAALHNHLGKKCFAFSSLDKSNIPDIFAKFKDKSEDMSCAMQSKGV